MSNPPKLMLKFFRWFCHPDLVKYIEGDLIELFEERVREKGVRKAKWLFVWDVMKLFRPGLIKSIEGTQKLNYYGMFRNFVTIGIRSLKRQKDYSLLNISGLTIGIVVVILTALWVQDELSFNQEIKDFDRIAQVLKRRTHNGETAIRWSLPIPVMDELQTTYGDDFDQVVIADWISKKNIAFESKSLNISGSYMSDEAPRLLSLNMIEGTRDGLASKFGILLSQSTSNAIFGNVNPIGKQIKVEGEFDMLVSGVYEDIPSNSDFKNLNFIANYSALESSRNWMSKARSKKFWNTNFCQIYVKLSEQANLEVVEERIKNIIYEKTDNSQLKASNPELVLHPMKDWHLRSEWENGVQSGGVITYVWLLSFLALFVLLLSCINFINLSTARAKIRAKEVGVRKTLGSARRLLVFQFAIESSLVVILSYVLAIGLSYTLLPFFNDLTGRKLSMPTAQMQFWLYSIGLLSLTSLLASAYPSFYLSSFRPVRVLKGTTSNSKSSEKFRQGLVVLQFAISISLILGTLVVHQQVQHSKSRDVGYNANSLITVSTASKDFHGKHDLISEALAGTGAVTSMSQSSSPLTEINSSNGAFDWSGKDPNLDINFATVTVTPEFGKTIGWKVVKGRDFSSARTTDENAIICNTAAIDFMNLQNPLGTTVNYQGRDYKIIGIVENMLVESPYDPVRPAVYFIDRNNLEHMQIRLNKSADHHDALTLVEQAWHKVIPNIPFDFQYVDQVFARKFVEEERLGKLLSMLTFLAILISMLGLFGLSTYVAEQRSKELSIRKVLGASLGSILRLLVSDFMKPIVVALLVAVPISWYFLDQWLNDYEYRIELSIGYFVFAGLISMTITLITISKRSFQIALSNPTKYLKDE